MPEELKYPGEEEDQGSVQNVETSKEADQESDAAQEKQEDFQKDLGKLGETAAALALGITGQPVPRPPYSMEEARAHFQEYIAEVDSMFARAKEMVVDNDSTNVDATALGTSAMALYHRIKDTKPKVRGYEDAKEYVGFVDSLESMLCEKLYSTNKKAETIVSLTKAKISAYSAVLEAERLRQEKLEREAREKLDRELKEEFGDKAPAVEGPLISSKRDRTVRTETGSAYATHQWKHEIVDEGLPAKLILELLSLVDANMGKAYEVAKRLDALLRFITISYNTPPIRQAIKDGLRDIEGLRIFEDIGTRFRKV